MGKKTKGRKRSRDRIEDRVAESVNRSEKQRLRQARGKALDPELIDKMRELTDEDSVARSFLEKALAEAHPDRRKNLVRD